MNFVQALKDFEDFHLSLANRIFHYFGISLITLASLGLCDRIPFAWINPATALLLGTVLLDAWICPAYALPVLLVGSLFLLLSKLFSVYQLLGIFALGWFFQLAGHRFAEKNKPAFLQNLIHLYIGPRWMLMQWLHIFGWLSRQGDHLRINTDIPDVLRWLLARLTPVLGNWAHAKVQKQVKGQAQRQRALREAYQVETLNVSPYTEELRSRLITMQAAMPGSVFIYTSGSTSRPKQIIYNRERLKIFKTTSALTALQTFKLLQVANPSMFVFASLQKDDSFASLVVTQEERLPGLLQGIIEPAKFMFHPLLRQALSVYGANALRLWIIAMNDPALLYATNPSTLLSSSMIWPRTGHPRKEFSRTLSQGRLASRTCTKTANGFASSPVSVDPVMAIGCACWLNPPSFHLSMLLPPL